GTTRTFGAVVQSHPVPPTKLLQLELFCFGTTRTFGAVVQSHPVPPTKLLQLELFCSKDFS
ncbi:hypothetical protein IJH72_02520, partial [Candidatus Saccharibacteria bacterium]|nr:hypothetical protein [Candidatus Saccharibacteria bacterium]